MSPRPPPPVALHDTVRRRNLATAVFFLDGHAEGAETRVLEVAQALAMEPFMSTRDYEIAVVWIWTLPHTSIHAQGQYILSKCGLRGACIPLHLHHLGSLHWLSSNFASAGANLMMSWIDIDMHKFMLHKPN